MKTENYEKSFSPMRIIKSSIGELKSTVNIAFSGMLLALRSVLGMFSVLIIPTIKIGFSFLPVALSGMLYGPFVSALIGGLGDIISYILNPTGGAYFPGFTLSGIISGLIYGMFFYKKKNITLIRIIACVCTEIILVELLLSSLWLNIMLSKAYLVILSGRILKAAVSAPFEIVLISLSVKAVKMIQKYRSI